MKTVSVCHLYGCSSLDEELLSWISCSKNTLKRYLSKKELKKPVFPKEEILLPLNLVNYNRINPTYQGAEVSIVYEDKDILIVNKPFRLHMHPLSYDEKDNLLVFLRQYNYLLLDVNKDSYDRGFLFRLDYETSGLCFYAKSDELYKFVRTHFLEVAKKKEYYAIVEGKIEVGEEKRLASHLAPYGERGHLMRVIEGKEPNAFLSYKSLAYCQKENISLLVIQLETGMRHQIRAQLSSVGYPILGDFLYGGREAPRLFLHAFYYSIQVNKQRFSATCKPDSLFCNFFDFN